MSAALEAPPIKTRARPARVASVPAASPSLVPTTYQDETPASWLNFIARAMADPSTNVDKLEVLVRMRREILADEARHAFNSAMASTQAEMVPVVRDADNRETHSKYARLETIDGVIRPIYTRHGFCLSYNSEPIEGSNIRIVCEVSHTGRHSKFYALEAAWDTVGPKGTVNKTPIHGMSSSVTYLRRYLMCMIFNVILRNEDTDGNRPNVTEIAPPKPRITVEELYALLAACSADPSAVADNEARFLQRMEMVDVRRLTDALPADFPRLRNALLAKRTRLAKAMEAVQ